MAAIVCRCDCRESGVQAEAESVFSSSGCVIEKAYNYEHGLHLKPGHVKATTFWRVEGKTFIGEVGIRHQLTPALMQYTRHIGYEVRHSACGQGYGTKMLAMVLPYCKNVRGLDRVLLTCDDDNIASQKVIERNGGVLENKVINQLERGTVLTRRYWFEL